LDFHLSYCSNSSNHFCINLDAAADAYVSDIFGKQYTVIDNIARLPEQLPKLFMALTR